MTDRPSYILFITDQQRYDHLGCNGHRVRTPNIDAIAESGVNFDRFYVASPVCMPNHCQSDDLSDALQQRGAFSGYATFADYLPL